MAIRAEFLSKLSSSLGRTLAILWAALTLSPVLFMVVGWVLTNGPNASPRPAVDPILIQVLIGLGGVLVASSVLVHRLLTEQDRLARGQSLIPRGQAEVSPVVGASQPTPEGPAEEALAEASRQYFVASIIALAVSESGAIMGLVLTVLSGSFGYVATLAGAAVVVDILFLRPDSEIYARLAPLIECRTA